MHKNGSEAVHPWYREPWPWLLASGPIAAILAGIVTMYIAVVGADGLVADDYYKRGLSINRELARDAEALRLGLTAHLEFLVAERRLTLRLSAADGVTLPERVTVLFVHPARAADDHLATLQSVAPGRYSGSLAIDAETHAKRIIAGTDRWRIVGQWNEATASGTLRPSVAAPAAKE